MFFKCVMSDLTQLVALTVCVTQVVLLVKNPPANAGDR